MNATLFPVEKYDIRPSEEWDNDSYETPSNIAQKMARLLISSTDKVVLEPAAGTGQIAGQIPSVYQVACCEIKKNRFEQGRDLKGAWQNWVNKDFLDFDPKDIGWNSSHVDVIIGNPPFSLALPFIQHGLTLLNPDYDKARILFLLPVDTFCSKERGDKFRSLDCRIHRVHLISGRIDYLKVGIPMSKQINPKTGERYGSRQNYDAVFDIRPGKNDGTISFL